MRISDWSSDVCSSDLVFRHAVVRMAESVETALEKNGNKPSEIDWLVPHQANIRIMDAMMKRLDLPRSRIIITVESQANTSAATIPLAIAAATPDGRIKRDDRVALTALGGGFTWGRRVSVGRGRCPGARTPRCRKSFTN